jgi:hypothetical protein
MGDEFDWDDLRQFLNRVIVLDRENLCADCVRGFGFLTALTDDERLLAREQHQREQVMAGRVRAALR